MLEETCNTLAYNTKKGNVQAGQVVKGILRNPDYLKEQVGKRGMYEASSGTTEEFVKDGMQDKDFFRSMGLLTLGVGTDKVGLGSWPGPRSQMDGAVMIVKISSKLFMKCRVFSQSQVTELLKDCFG